MTRQRTISRIGVVQTAAKGCTTIQVGVPCAGCTRAGCVIRRQPGFLQLEAAPALSAGQAVNVSLSAQDLTRISSALFGPPLVWLVLTGMVTAGGFGHSNLIGIGGFAGLFAAMSLGAWLGRRAAAELAIDVAPVDSISPGASEV